jgi:hypothetical protein
MDEIIRCIMALQVSYKHDIQTPAHWPNNRALLPSAQQGKLQQHKGVVFLLPTVSDNQAKKRFHEYHTASVPSGKTYLRMVKPEETGILDNLEWCNVGSGSFHPSDADSSNGSSPFSTTTKTTERQERSLLKHKKALSEWFMGLVGK